jgi:hypothetical protein
MAATLAAYNPQLYANKALPLLYSYLGLGSRVYRDLDMDYASASKGQQVNIRRPGTFAVADAPATAEDVAAETVSLSLDYWRESKFKLTDKELTFSEDKILAEHVAPAMAVLADDIDQKLQAEYYNFGRKATAFATGSSAGVNFANVQKAMIEAKIPQNDPGKLHYMIDPTMNHHYVSDSSFAQWQGAGPAGEAVARSGSLGIKYGMETFVTHNTVAHTSGTGADLAGAVDGATAKLATSITIDGLTDTETFLKGDSFTIAGDSTVYAITTATSTVTSNAITVSIEPPLRAAAANNAVVTFDATTDYTSQGLGFHQNCMALAMAPLSQMGNELGARIGVARDPLTGLAMRTRIYYVGNSSEIHMAFDVLFGVKVLDGRMAVRHGRA